MIPSPSSAKETFAIPDNPWHNIVMPYPSVHIPGHLYFVTAALCGWKHLFIEDPYARIVLGSLEWLRQQGRMALFAYVLMPSHMHAILKPNNRSIGQLLSDFGSYTAHAILKQLRSEQREDLLQFFHQQRRDKRHQHSIWQDIQAQNVYSADFLWQKLEYVHSNPLRKEWRLVEDRADYGYSSACFYDRGECPVVDVDDLWEYLGR
jgi:REP element-mobilizing transposase RayT